MELSIVRGGEGDLELCDNLLYWIVGHGRQHLRQRRYDTYPRSTHLCLLIRLGILHDAWIKFA